MFATNIAKWNGSSWTALSSGVGGGVDGSGNLYIGGNFTIVGDV
jgi:hypothetical protein